MLYIFEAFFVGIYSCIIYSLIIPVIDEYLITLFVVGFLKHFLGFELSLHSIYCKFGSACERSNHRDEYIAKVGWKQLLTESLLEGSAFMALGYLFSFLSNDKLLGVFLIGFTLHNVTEISGLHHKFCKKRCIRQPMIPLFEPAMFHAT
jgi:hypothetical protein